MQHTNEFLKLVMNAKNNIEEVSVDYTNELMNNKTVNQDYYLIDVREDNEWDDGYIIHALHMSKGTIERDIEKKISNKDIELVLYCKSGYRSILAADTLKKMGYTNVKSMAEGFNGWIQKQYPIVD
tara:strand:+ start:11755 stop:12132 length:378 start_codon:yes stop_codon:yes gene_type:complete